MIRFYSNLCATNFNRRVAYIVLAIYAIFAILLIFKPGERVKSEKELENERRLNLIYINEQIEKYHAREVDIVKISNSCKSFLQTINPPVSAILIDQKILKSVLEDKCDELGQNVSSIEIAVLKISEKFKNDPRFTAVEFENLSEKDYFSFSTEPRRIIPKRLKLIHVGNFLIPGRIPKFLEYWKRSKFIECSNRKMKRDGRGRKGLEPQYAVKALSLLRDIIVDHDMYPFLFDGSLLGWYRECNIIPHTFDMDFAVFASEYNPELIPSIRNSEILNVTRILGKVNDSFEITTDVVGRGGALTDVFLMYRETLTNEFSFDFTGSIDHANRLKVKFIYPNYDPWCAADLLGHLFWVTCSPDVIIPWEFGEKWYQDVPTSEYHWYLSVRNTMLNGRPTEEEVMSRGV